MPVHILTEHDARLASSPWGVWRNKVAVILGILPEEVDDLPNAYAEFNDLVTPADYCEQIEAELAANALALASR